MNLKHTHKNAINAAPYKLPWFIQYIHPFSPDHTTHSFFKGSIFSQFSGSPSHMLNIPFAPGVGNDRFIPKSSNNVAGRPFFASFVFGNPESRSCFSLLVSLTLFLEFFKRRSMAAIDSSSEVLLSLLTSSLLLFAAKTRPTFDEDDYDKDEDVRRR